MRLATDLMRAAVPLFLAAFMGACSVSEVGTSVMPRDGAAVDAPLAMRPDGPPPVCRGGASVGKGLACGCDADCGSGHCVEGVCCETACQGRCQSCTVQGSLGLCTPVPAGKPPAVAGQCEMQADTTCGTDGTCDGAGACRKWPDGTSCGGGRCGPEGVISGAKQCRAGVCASGADTFCSPFACDPASGACAKTCTDASQCVGGRPCVAGSCGKKSAGAECGAATDCESGFCVDGVCCNTSCGEACMRCDAPGTRGQCTPAGKGEDDPHKLCRSEGPETCGLSGTCDGRGACAKYAAGVVCKPGSCAGSSQMPAGSCDGQGACVTGQAIPCAPYMCRGQSCIETCVTDSDCIGSACVNGSCGKRGLGQTCKAATDCGSGFCVDGVCCNEACGGRCRYCASATDPGVCINVPSGVADPRAGRGVTDPALVCLDQGRASCGTNGTCDGFGGCTRYGKGTACKAESCDAATNTYHAASACDGVGACVEPAPTACDPNKCNGARCADSCTNNQSCVAPAQCLNGSCGTKPDGQTCAQASECSSGVCAQGVCCGTACAGSCMACNVEGQKGVCVPVPSGGADPAGACKDQKPTSCGANGMCDGFGACAKYPTGTTCAAESCTAGAYTGAGVCDGAGTCNRPKETLCAPYMCNGNSACFGSCTTNTQCAGGAVCTNGSCGKKALGAGCTADSECAGGHCVDKTCCAVAVCGTCQSCANPSGACTNVANNVADPDTCKADGTTCGVSGKCDGKGVCKDADKGIACGSTTCNAAGTGEVHKECSGGGACAETVKDCGTYACSGNACLTSCKNNKDCKGLLTSCVKTLGVGRCVGL